jgi:hypothetical protein
MKSNRNFGNMASNFLDGHSGIVNQTKYAFVSKSTSLNDMSTKFYGKKTTKSSLGSMNQHFDIQYAFDNLPEETIVRKPIIKNLVVPSNNLINIKSYENTNLTNNANDFTKLNLSKIYIITNNHLLNEGYIYKNFFESNNIISEVVNLNGEMISDSIYRDVLDNNDKILLLFGITTISNPIILYNLKHKCLIYQIEQKNILGTSDLYVLKDFLKEMPNIIEFSHNNDIYTKNLDLKLPLIQSQTNNTQKDIDILFFGSLSSRRKNILKQLYQLKKYKLKYIYNTFGDELLNLIKRSKIVLNLHTQNNSFLEVFRINLALSYNTYIISESPIHKNEKYLYDLYKKLVFFIPQLDPYDNNNYNNLTKLIDKLLKANSINLGDKTDKINILNNISQKVLFENLNIMDSTINNLRKSNLDETLFHKYYLKLETTDNQIKYNIIKTNISDYFIERKYYTHLHCYDISNFNEIYEEYFDTICRYFSVIVTYSIGNNTIDNNSDLVILKIPNKGMDIGGKFCAVKYLNDNNITYEYILFLHSKSNPETRRKYFKPLIDNLDDEFIKNINENDGYFPDIQWEIVGDRLKMISGNLEFADSNLPERNLLYRNRLLKYLGANNNTNKFIEGNCYILSKRVINKLYTDPLLYNILNTETSFDYNWICKSYNIQGDIYEIYKQFRERKLSPRNQNSYDGYFEHVFERVVLNFCNNYKCFNHPLDTTLSIIKKFGFKLNNQKNVNNVIANGIGDLLITILLVKNGLINTPVYINLRIYIDTILFKNNIKDLIFRCKLIKELCEFNNISQDNFVFIYNNNVINGNDYIQQQIELSNFQLDLPCLSIPNKNMEILKDKKYIVFHTKLRMYQGTDYNIIVSDLKNFYNNFKTDFTIVLLGEQKIKVCNGEECIGTRTLYNELLLLKNNNKVIDLTTSEIYGNLDYEKYILDMQIVKNAQANIIVGCGGHYVSSLCFSSGPVFTYWNNILKTIWKNRCNFLIKEKTIGPYRSSIYNNINLYINNISNISNIIGPLFSTCIEQIDTLKYIKKNKEKKICIVIPHNGTGDNINTLSLCNYLAFEYDIVIHCVPTISIYDNMKLFYINNPKIKLFKLDTKINHAVHIQNMSISNFIDNEIFNYVNKIYAIGVHNYNQYLIQTNLVHSNDIINNVSHLTSCLEHPPLSFISQLKLPRTIFYEYINIPDIIESDNLYEYIKNIPYIFCVNHDSTGFCFDATKILNILGNKNLLVINPNKNFYQLNHTYYNIANKFVNKPILYYKKSIENCNYIVTTPSSFFCFAIQLNIKTTFRYYIGKYSYEYLFTNNNHFHKISNILYLLNHKTLTEFDLPIINDNNHYCYIPKIYKSIGIEQSVNTKSPYNYDNLLSINPKDIKILNNIDFFKDDTIFSPEEMKIMNLNFKCIFLTLLTSDFVLQQLLKKFDGIICFRFFGLAGQSSYKTFIEYNYNINYLYNNDKVKYIFSYQEIIDFEFSKSNFFNTKNSYFIPLGLPNDLINKLYNTYNPIENKIAFVCSRTDDGINTYYHNIYKEFINNFRNYDYIIFGKNNNGISHLPNIKNNLPDDLYYRGISQCKCLFYHSKENRHLHYHPLEAMVIGIPIIFYKESLLSSYLNDSEGKCKDIYEVKFKIDKILSNSTKLITSIINTQNAVIHKLKIDNNMDIFYKLFQ